MDFSTLWIGRTASCSPPTHTPRQPGVAARMPRAGQLRTKKVRQLPRGALRALDPTDGQLKWEFRHISPTYSGVLSTAGGLLFTGDAEGNFIALDAATGKPLWHFQMGGAVYASPMAFAVDGREYVAIAAGSSLDAVGLP